MSDKLDLRTALLSAPPLTPDVAFAAQLEERLRSAATTTATISARAEDSSADAVATVAVAELAPGRRGTTPRQRGLLVAAVVACVVIVAATIVARRENSTRVGAGPGTAVGYRLESTLRIIHEGESPSHAETVLTEGTINTDALASDVTMRDSKRRGEAISERAIGATTYFGAAGWLRAQYQASAEQRRIIADKHWIAFRGGTPGPNQTTHFSLDALVAATPFVGTFDLLDGMRRSHVAVHAIGRATVRGVATSGYRVKRNQPVKYATGTRVTHTTIDFWLDGEGQVRRLHVSERAPETDDSAPITYDTVTDFFDFGDVPLVRAPSPADVADGKLVNEAGRPQP